MLLKRFIVISLIPLAFLLAACGGSDSPTAAPTDAPAQDAPDVQEPADADDAPQLSAIGDGTFEYAVSGAQELSIDGGQGVVVRNPGMEVSGITIEPHIEIMLSNGSMSSELYMVLITTPPDTGTGTYELTDPSMSADGFAAEYSYINMEDMDSADFMLNVSGTLTLTEAGDRYSGTFEFSADGGFGTEDDTVIVSGSFSNLEAFDAEGE